MKPTVHLDMRRVKPTEYRDEGMKPTEFHTGLTKPIAYDTVSLTGVIEADYVYNGWK